MKTNRIDCDFARPYRLKNTIQHYSWGTRGDRAFIPHLLSMNPDNDEPYAELWMGVHPTSPSVVIDPKNEPQLLSKWIAENPPERLSQKCSDDFPDELPYLLKVLSIGQALSIQAHPNKAQAALLHQNDPKHYPDDNHKPEIAIAIDYLIALVGFINSDQFADLYEDMPELQTLLSWEDEESPDLRTAVMALLELNDVDLDKIDSCVQSLKNRLTLKDDCSEIELLFLEQLEHQDTQDIGLIFLFLMNMVHLSPGEAIFLPPGVPHAYLKGNIIECMANSDNVVRLGLTNKFCDARALSEVLVFDVSGDYRVEISSDGYITEYKCAISEFRVKSLDLLQGESRAFSYRTQFTMFLLLEGEVSLHWGSSQSACVSIFRRGDSFITPANLSEFSLQAKGHSKLYLVELP